MNSGKTTTVISIAGALPYSGYDGQFMLFSNSLNTRDGPRFISSAGLRSGEVYIADAKDPRNVLDLIAQREKETKKRQQILIFDEVNLHSHKFVPIILQLMAEGRTPVTAGLDLDFRGEDFGPMGRLMAIARRREDSTGKKLVIIHTSYCTAVDDGVQCKEIAPYSLRLCKNPNGKEVPFMDTDRKLVRGFEKVPYYDPTILVEGTNKNVKYTTVCRDHFGVLPGTDLVKGILEDVLINGSCSYEDLLKKHQEDSGITSALAYAIEERKLDAHNGIYKPCDCAHHPTDKEIRILSDIGKIRDASGTSSTLDIYQQIRDTKGISRDAVLETYKNITGIERILADLTSNGLAKLEGTTMTVTPYLKDPASGMYVPLDRLRR